MKGQIYLGDEYGESVERLTGLIQDKNVKNGPDAVRGIIDQVLAQAKAAGVRRMPLSAIHIARPRRAARTVRRTPRRVTRATVPTRATAPGHSTVSAIRNAARKVAAHG